MVVQKYTKNLYSSEVYRELERQAVRKGHFEPTPEEIVKAAATKISQQQTINKPIDASPSEDLIQDIARLAYAMRRKGFVSQAEDLEDKLMAYKVAETDYYKVKTDNPDFSIREKEQDFEIVPAKDGHGKVETIFSTQKKTHDIATKNPTGKLAEASSPFYGVTQEKNIDYMNFAHRDGDVNIVGVGDLGTFETVQSVAEKILAVTRKQPTGALPKNASLSDIAKLVTAQMPAQGPGAESNLPTYDIDITKKYLAGVANLLEQAAAPEINFSKVLTADGSGTYLHGDGHGAALFNMLTGNKATAVVNYGSLVRSLFGGKPPTDPTAIQNAIYENIRTKKENYVNGIPKTAQYLPSGSQFTVQQQAEQAFKNRQQQWDEKAKELAPQYAAQFGQAQSAAFQAVSEASRQLAFFQEDAKKIADFLNKLANTDVKTLEDALVFAGNVKRDTGGLKDRIMWPARILQGFGKGTEASQLAGAVDGLIASADRVLEQAKKSTKLMNDLDTDRLRATLGRLASVKSQLEKGNKEYALGAEETLAAVNKMINTIRQRAGAGNVKYLLDGLKEFGNYTNYQDLDNDTMGLLEDVKRDIARAAERK